MQAVLFAKACHFSSINRHKIFCIIVFKNIPLKNLNREKTESFLISTMIETNRKLPLGIRQKTNFVSAVSSFSVC